MNRIILKVKLLNGFGINLQLMHLDPRFMSNENEFISHHYKDKSFMLYSRSDLALTINTIRLPDKKNYKPNQQITYFFNDEKDRYNFLRCLRRTIIDWSENFDRFKRDSDYRSRNRNLIMSNEFWIM